MTLKTAVLSCSRVGVSPILGSVDFDWSRQHYMNYMFEVVVVHDAIPGQSIRRGDESGSPFNERRVDVIYGRLDLLSVSVDVLRGNRPCAVRRYSWELHRTHGIVSRFPV